MSDNKLVCLIPQRDEENYSVLVVDSSLIENKERKNLFDKDGYVWGEEHGSDDVSSITVWNGHHYQSYTINDDYAPFTDFKELNDRDAEDILTHLAEAEDQGFEDGGYGIHTSETKTYIFEKSQWTGSFGIKVITKQ